jgi:hypothetical protein
MASAWQHKGAGNLGRSRFFYRCYSALTLASAIAMLHCMEEQDARRVDLIQSLGEEIKGVDEEIQMPLVRHEILVKWRDALRRGSTETIRLPPYPPRF